MSDQPSSDQDSTLRDLPEPKTRSPRRWSVSVIWLVPVVAALAGLVLVLRAYLAAGPSIVISFKNAEGIETGTTELRYKEVPIGKVRKIELAKDGKHVLVHVGLVRSASKVAVEDSRFWVVRPRVGLGGVSGLGTLISGAYIGVDLGRSENERLEFEGLENPPPVTHDQVGRRFMLRSRDLGSLDIGSPVYFRRIAVGRVVAYELDEDGRNVILQIFIDAPYDRFVNTNTRFWNASGVDVQIGATGVKLNTQSLTTLVAGGLAFQSVPEDEPAQAAPADTEFTLFEDRAAALAPSQAESLRAHLRFYQSTRGLAVDAPVDFQGVDIGRVRGIELHYDRQRRDFWTDVRIDVFPRRLGKAFQNWQQNTERQPKTADTFLRMLVERGLRGQLRIGNLITGQLYVALDFDPKAPRVVPDPAQSPLEIPTTRGEFEQIQGQVASIVSKIDAIPFADIGKELRDTLVSTNKLVQQIDARFVPELQQTVEEAQRTLGAAAEVLSDESGLQRDARRSFVELERASRSLRVLADFLQRHPESLIRGKGEPRVLEPMTVPPLLQALPPESAAPAPQEAAP